ncbi:MAG: FAD-dependent oxidoreductase [Chloroflexi bacterium]|nr:FAD-dependent oxidoreductase [Chloroflexota bacterium]
MRFETIIVGAGPAGIAAALTLARAGVKVLVLERGPYPGSKNTFGGVLYRQPMEQLIPEFWKKAPIERYIVTKQVWLMTSDSTVLLGHYGKRFSQEPFNAFTVLRAKFDHWFAEQAEAAGAIIVTSTTATGVLRENGRVVGVRTDREQGDVYADVVVAADGVNSLLSQQSGLRGELQPSQVALAVKEIISLTEEKIRDRFQLEGDEGADIMLLGHLTKGLVGGGFIYTNRDTISIGVSVEIADMVANGVSPAELIDELKAHPFIRPLIQGGQVREYQAHLIPEGGYKAIPPLYRDGYLVVGDAAGLVNTVYFEGANHALNSGRLAAETILEARAKEDFSTAVLSNYQRRLEASVTLQDLKAFRDVPSFLHGHRQLFTLYPDLLNEAAHDFITVDGVPKKVRQRSIIRKILRGRPLMGLAKDLWDVWRTLA